MKTVLRIFEDGDVDVDGDVAEGTDVGDMLEKHHSA
jgi:hypothetical protein